MTDLGFGWGSFDLADVMDCDMILFLGEDFGALTFPLLSDFDLAETFSAPFEVFEL